MSLFVASLNSGSNGNCYYVGTADEAVLIDGGISCRETERRMKRLNLPLKRVKAIFVTHEHSDHVYGVARLSKKYSLPVYITTATQAEGRIELGDGLAVRFNPHESVRVGNLTVTAFPKSHDASDPHSFVVSSPSVTVGIFTDIGIACEHVIRHFKQCHAAFLESNYDEYILETGRYPVALKNRIRDGRGHLSNRQALRLFLEHRPSYMTHLFLSHLSKNNNSPRIVRQMFEPLAGSARIVIAPRNKETPLYHIRNIPRERLERQTPMQVSQLSLFAAS